MSGTVVWPASLRVEDRQELQRWPKDSQERALRPGDSQQGGPGPESRSLCLLTYYRLYGRYKERCIVLILIRKTDLIQLNPTLA